jgi:AcrR family transcriptional regulator
MSFGLRVMNGKTKPRELAKQETRDALIRAGMAAFSEEGVDLPSLDAICARAGFTRGAFYVHFKDREDFFAAVADQALQDFINWVISAGEAQAGLRGVVERYFAALQEGKSTLGDPHKLLMQIVARGSQQNADGSEAFSSLIRNAVDRLSEVVKQGQDAGAVKRDLDAAELGLLLMSSGVGFIVLLAGGMKPDFSEMRALTARWLFISGAGPSH